MNNELTVGGREMISHNFDLIIILLWFHLFISDITFYNISPFCSKKFSENFIHLCHPLIFHAEFFGITESF